MIKNNGGQTAGFYCPVSGSVRNHGENKKSQIFWLYTKNCGTEDKSFTRATNYVVEYAVKYSEYVESYIRSDKTTALRDRVNICCYVGARLASGYFYR